MKIFIQQFNYQNCKKSRAENSKTTYLDCDHIFRRYNINSLETSKSRFALDVLDVARELIDVVFQKLHGARVCNALALGDCAARKVRVICEKTGMECMKNEVNE